MNTGSYDMLVLNFQQRDILLYNLFGMALVAAAFVVATEVLPENWPIVRTMQKGRTQNYALLVAMWIAVLIMNVLIMGAR